MNSRRVMTKTLVIFAVFFGGVVISGGVLYRAWVTANGLEAAQKWARMSALPETATCLHVETRGGPFTREFTIQFTAPSDDLNSWLNRSPGTSKLNPVIKGRFRVYNVEPGNGAMHAEVTVDDGANLVVIHTFWS